MKLSPSQYKQQFLSSELAAEVQAQLDRMEADPNYHTGDSYSSLSEAPVGFAKKHFTYICEHPAVKPQEYLSNLRLKTQVRKY
jgi:hypothetical protein